MVPIYEGRHLEGNHLFSQEKKVQTRLLAMASAHEQLSGEAMVMRYSPIDFVEMIPLGTAETMESIGTGILQTESPVLVRDDRVWVTSTAAEFEPALYQFEVSRSRTHVTPLIPRGFVEDLAIYAQVAQDSDQGSVLVEFGHPKDLDSSVNIRLLDQYGRDVGEGWYFSDKPLTKAMFFNVNPGVYTILAETKDRYWLAANTVYVYNETVSYMNIGAELRFRAVRKRDEDEH